MTGTPEELAAKMDALGLWEVLERCNWALKPRGVALPYFCTALRDASPSPVKVRFIMLEGWQTLHDYIHLRVDRGFGFYSSPYEMPHFCLTVFADGNARVFRHDTGYCPRLISEDEKPLVMRMLWQAYGVMLRLESERDLPMRFAADKAMFTRIEGENGEWSDAPLEIPPPRPYVEKITLSREDVKAVQDLPFAAGETLALDFRLLGGLATAENRPRSVYALVGVDPETGETAFDRRVSVGRDGGLKALWESVPTLVLKEFISRGRVPGRVKLVSPRTFRMVRAVCMELPLKLSLHDSLPALESAFDACGKA